MILEIIILVLGIPVGFLISYLAKDELKKGKKYFRILIILSILGLIGFWIYGFKVEALASAFIGIVALVSFLKA